MTKIWEMRNIKIIAYSILCLFLSLLLSCNNNEAKINFDDVYVLKVAQEGKQTNYGTCFYSEGVFYTNAHMILYKDYDEYFVCDNIIAIDEINNNEYELSIISYDLSNDYAELETDENLGHGLVINSKYAVTIGEDIYTIGNLNNYGLAFGYGKITSYSKTINNLGHNICYYQTNIEISSGNSGGPIFNSKNEVIGIMSLKLVDSSGSFVDGVSFFILI